jgi:hypothetical protein
LALLVFRDPILDIYGVDANPHGVYMAAGSAGLIATGLTTGWRGMRRILREGERSAGPWLAFTYGVGVILALWGTLSGPFNALGWVAVGLNLFLGSSFAWREFIRPRTSSASPS